MLKLLVVAALSVGSVPQAPESTRPAKHSSPYERVFTVDAITVPTVSTPKPEPRKQPSGGHHSVIIHPQWDGIQRGPCNMPIVVGDASADPRILIPHSHSREAKIRVVQAPACGAK